MEFQRFSLQDDTHKAAPTMQHKGRTIFCNENELAKYPPKIPLKAIWQYYYKYPKNAKPKRTLPSIDSDFKAIYETPNVAWLGHSSLFFTYKDIAILVDPLFTMHASPFAFINRAFLETKCFESHHFPKLLAVIITHAHFDHLDKRSVLALRHQTQYFICPLGVGAYLRGFGIEEGRIIELDWWEGVALFESQDTSVRNNADSKVCHHCNIYTHSNTQSIQSHHTDSQEIRLPTLTITATPAQHNSARFGDFNRALWASFVLEYNPKTPNAKRIFMSGDGGYYTHFGRIGEYFGGFDLACLESGQYNEAWRFSHSFPHEIIQEALDLRAQMVLPIHWGRFVAGTHAWNGVIRYLYEHLPKHNIPCIAPKIGELYEIGANLNQEACSQEVWWLEETEQPSVE